MSYLRSRGASFQLAKPSTVFVATTDPFGERVRPFPAVLLPRDELIMITGDDLRRRLPDAAIERPDLERAAGCTVEPAFGPDRSGARGRRPRRRAALTGDDADGDGLSISKTMFCAFGWAEARH